MVDHRKLRKKITMLPFTFQLNRNFKPDNWKDIGQDLQLHKSLKDLFQWSMDKNKFKLTSHLEELGEGFQKICLKEIPFKDLIIITKGWNPNRKFYSLKERQARIREN
ncbi:hypothetical protein O181_054883 [Austropuccinia psidii MF-1]|uniref:Uncharacterized protein n=1 Tax=Austropuccinia psidii MF-1 TaxID=1389203 RepID=A0A9Q3HRV3_9BASI|nr:hypothetical protein [Austropuccinia psidii MF-1]